MIYSVYSKTLFRLHVIMEDGTVKDFDNVNSYSFKQLCYGGSYDLYLNINVGGKQIPMCLDCQVSSVFYDDGSINDIIYLRD